MTSRRLRSSRRLGLRLGVAALVAVAVIGGGGTAVLAAVSSAAQRCSSELASPSPTPEFVAAEFGWSWAAPGFVCVVSRTDETSLTRSYGLFG